MSRLGMLYALNEDGDYKTCASWERQGAHHPS